MKKIALEAEFRTDGSVHVRSIPAGFHYVYHPSHSFTRALAVWKAQVDVAANEAAPQEETR